MKAVIIKETGKAELVDIKEQSMRPKYIKVKTVAVGLNPSTWELLTCPRDLLTSLADFQMTDGDGAVGSILGSYDCHDFMELTLTLSCSTTGCDLSGTVEEVGSECKTEVEKGDRVFGICHGGNHVRPLPVQVSGCDAEPVLSSNNSKMVRSQSSPWSKMATWLRFRMA